MCDVVGVIGVKDASRHAYVGLISGQNRGQESAGILSYDGQKSHMARGHGLVREAIKDSELERLTGDIALGQTRYSTAGGPYHAAQPIIENHERFGEFSIVHNGNMVNYEQLERRVREAGAYDYKENPSDSQLFARLLSLSDGATFEEALRKTLDKVKPTYSLIVQKGEEVYVTRDKHGNRPLSIGKLDGGYAVASEEYDLKMMGCIDIEEVKEGEMIKLYKRQKTSNQIYVPEPQRCINELIYLAKGTDGAEIFGKRVQDIRQESGRRLAVEHPAVADLVIGILGSGYHASIGYSEQSGIPHSLTALIRNPNYHKRTFIEPNHAERVRGVYLKFTEDKKEINGKRIVVIDDSIVRLTTSSGLVGKLRLAGATGLDFRVASPPIKNPCFYGIDFPDKAELVAASLSVPEIEQHLRLRFFGVDYGREELNEIVRGNVLSQDDVEEIVGVSMRQDRNFLRRASKKKKADHAIVNPFDLDQGRFTLGYLSEQGLVESFGIDPSKYCLACFNGEYKIEPEIIMERLAA